MKKILAPLLVASTFFISCSKTDDPVTVEPDLSILAKKIVILITSKNNNSSYSITSSMTYNGTKLVSLTTEGFEMVTNNFTYTGDLITKNVAINSQNKVVSTTIYTYNSSNNLESTLELSVMEPDLENKKKYTYNSDGTVSFVSEETNIKTNNTTTKSTGKLYFAKGNLTKIEETVGPSTHVTTFEYDTKNNWQKNITGANKIIDDEATFSVNNVIKSTKITSYNNQANTVSINSYGLTYDNANFPTKSVYENRDYTQTITYTY